MEQFNISLNPVRKTSLQTPPKRKRIGNMSKDPAFLFYSSDFLTGCSDLTMEERGQYITMLCLQHQKGHLNEKTIRLSLGSISVDVRNKFLTDDEGNLYNEILENHIKERESFVESRRINGSKGGRPKYNTKPSGYPSGIAKNNLREDENKDEDLNINKDEKVNFENEFNEFWELYTPIKCDGKVVAKGNKLICKQKLIKILDKGESYEGIIEGLKEYLKYCKSNNVLSCGAEVFLNQRRWENDYSCGQTVDANKGAGRERQKPVNYLEVAARVAARYENKGQDDIY